MLEQIIGTWQIREFLVKKGGEATMHPWRKNISGMLIYTAEGCMSVNINSGELLIPSREEDYKEVYDSILMYAGTYFIDNEGLIHHLVQNSSNPARIGQNFIRKPIFDGDLLQLHGSTGTTEFILSWQRMPASRLQNTPKFGFL